MRTAFRLLAWATLLLDGYLLLGLVATRSMKREYHDLLPPYGQDWFRQIPLYALLLVVVWTGLLSVGCLARTGRRPS